MQPLAGLVLDNYFPPPLTVACPGLVTDYTLWDWYADIFTPKIKEYYHGDIVTKKSKIESQGQNEAHYWVILKGKVYDFTNYYYTLDLYDNLATYEFLDPTVQQMITENPGLDITSKWNDNFNSANASYQVDLLNNLNCFNNMFYAGIPDFRDTVRCQINNYILLAFTILLCSVIIVKFVSALQFGSKRRPSPQDKFVICQVPAYTEGEDSLRKALDSLTALQYDNKRKLICVICDGMIVGGGNDRPTPKIVLDILGVDPKIDPPALPFRAVGEGNEQLNYGKVYSGLYEFEGNVVPYLVVVKVGKESEQQKSKPGNRGKRDSQILLMSFLNRVHHRAPMNPLELEMFHQVNNIIGVDPELYEYLLMIDADTSVKEDSLNRLVAACANDAKIAGICGETSLENEERSWWTMIQVYEYYISHHLAKAFESLFGSVTCLPGCFTMYRLRTADKGKPLIISDKIIEEYSDCVVDTLHKKNLLSLGEDRFLTTLMTKHFPYMKYKFIPDAYASTAAPETWSVLLSQRRRQFPLISIIMIAGTYGLQALIFILKRKWQHIGWMIIYLLAFPIYSFVLPVYSFWNQDNFSWGNTRIVIGEKGDKQIVAVDDGEGFDPRSIPLQRWDDYALANNLPGRRGVPEKAYDTYEDQYEMDDMKSMYSSVKPASTILTGMPGRGPYMPPQSPGYNRQSMYSVNQYTDHPLRNQSAMSFRNNDRSASPYQDYPGQQRSSVMMHQSRSSIGFTGGARPVLGADSRPVSGFDFSRGPGAAGPDDMAIVEAIQSCLREVDLDNVTKKQGGTEAADGVGGGEEDVLG
ncbi:chitin synthase protein [Rutstroemia sp. NJR-2017a BBW]|nr:chitin synthase protein [Rutstroemia sp. NJR-2017a BBW]